MPPYPAAVLAQGLTCEQKAIWEVLHTMYVKGRGTPSPWYSAWHLAAIPFILHFRSEMPFTCALSSLLPGMAVPTYYCVLSVLIPLKVVCVILIFWVIAVKYPSLGCVRLQDGCWDRGRRPAVFSVCSERHNVQLSLWAVTILFNYVRF